MVAGPAGSRMTIKDELWALFRTQATHQLLTDQIERKLADPSVSDTMTNADSENEFELFYADDFTLLTSQDDP